MVLLTMTKAMVDALQSCKGYGYEPSVSEQHEGDPSLDAPAIGNPISHFQIVAISHYLRKRFADGKSDHTSAEEPSLDYDLDTLLRGSQVYIEPPKPKPEPTSEYKELMARLRRDEEARAYERMINPPLQPETFSQRFPNNAKPQLFPVINSKDDDEEEITYADVNRQMALIMNVLVTIVACAVAIWMASSHWTAPKRLALSMGGSGMIGVAEVVVYAGYLRRLKEARAKEKKTIEVKEIVKTWIIGGENDNHVIEKADEPVLIEEKANNDLRKRKSKAAT